MDGQILIVAGSTFADFVERHRPQLVRVLAVAGGDVDAAAAAIDRALWAAERRWERIDDDPVMWVLQRAVKEWSPTPVGEDELDGVPPLQRLDATLLMLEWPQSRRREAGAVPAPHAEELAERFAERWAGLGPVPVRSTRPPRLGLRVAAAVVALAAAAGAVLAAAGLGGPEQLATEPTLAPLPELDPVQEERVARLLPSPQLAWTTPLGIRATHFLQIGRSTFGYAQTSEGVRAWSTDDGAAWLDHGIVLGATGALRQVTEGGPGGLAVMAASENDFEIRLYGTADGTHWEPLTTPDPGATLLNIVGASPDVIVAETLTDGGSRALDTVLGRLGPSDLRAFREFGGYLDADEFVITGPFGGAAKRIPLTALRIDPRALGDYQEFRASLWWSDDGDTWSEIQDPFDLAFFGEQDRGTSLPGGEVAMPARGSTTRYLVVSPGGRVEAVSSDRLVIPLRSFDGDVVGLSGAYPAPQIVASDDLMDWEEVSPEYAGAITSASALIDLETGGLGMLTTFSRFERRFVDQGRFSYLEAQDKVLHFEFPQLWILDGATGSVLARILTVYDERLVIHDFDERTITFLHPTTGAELATVTFEEAASVTPSQAFPVDETVEVLFTPDGTEWSREFPPFYAGGPVEMTDFHVGAGFVVMAARETSFPFSGVHVLVGRPASSPSLPAR